MRVVATGAIDRLAASRGWPAQRAGLAAREVGLGVDQVPERLLAAPDLASADKLAGDEFRSADFGRSGVYGMAHALCNYGANLVVGGDFTYVGPGAHGQHRDVGRPGWSRPGRGLGDPCGPAGHGAEGTDE